MTLPVSRLVRVNINLSPLAATNRSFGVLLIAGDSPVINPVERYRTYGTIGDVGEDFSITMPEYKAALLYFGQTPKPATLMISRYLSTASSGQLLGGILTSSQQTLANFTAITNGGFHVTVDGNVKSVTGLDFSGASNLNAVAGIIDTALAGASVIWNGAQFIVTSDTTGTSSSVSFGTAPVSGVDITTLFKWTSVLALPLVPGFASETPDAYAATMANLSAAWYGLMFAATTMPTDDQNVAVAGIIEAQDLTRIFGVTITDTGVLSSVVTNDLASRLMALGYDQSTTQYSSSSAYAIASLFGRAFSVNFAANRSTITLMYKQEPGVLPENLSTSQANVLEAKNCNVFASYVNNTMIIQYGTMASGAWFDEIHGVDWLQDQFQTACYNLMYTSTSKIPQTDAGMNQFVNAISAGCEAGINNGLIAPGVWNADGFGQLVTGQFLQDGYYIYAQPIALQSQSDRETRVGTPIQVAVKFAGAIQELDVILNVNQ